MNRFRSCLAALLLVLSAPAAWSADLGQCRDTLPRLPALKTETPRYCLLVFGAQAEQRVWLVFDGADLYVDRDGSHDLTVPGKRVTRVAGSNWLDAGAITDKAGTTLGKLELSLTGNHVHLTLTVKEGCMQYVGFDPSDRLTFADKPADAPVVHFQGPLSMRLYNKKPAFLAGARPRFNALNFSIGTPGVGTGSFAALSCCSLPKGVAPIAYIEYPHVDADQPPIRAEYRLDGD